MADIKYLINSKNLKIKAAKDDDFIEIELFGDVGESWFGEDTITMDKVKDIINENKTRKILFKIASLGGSVHHAFVIYDLIRLHKASTKTLIMGLTASSGTIISLATDYVEISENALFLIHNAWTMAIGNADELRAVADDLDTIDERIVNIYEKKTGKSRQAIVDLMQQEKWISPEEAIEFGFVDEINERTFDIAAHYSKDKLNLLPNKLQTKLEKMGFLNKKSDKSKATNIVDLKDENTKLLIEGDLEEGCQVLDITGTNEVQLEGEHELKDGRKVTVDKDGKVTDIAEKPDEANDDMAAFKADIIEEVSEIVAELKIEFDKLRGEGSTHKPKPQRKPENKAEITDVDDNQASVKEGLKEKVKEKVDQHKKDQAKAIN